MAHRTDGVCITCNNEKHTSEYLLSNKKTKIYTNKTFESNSGCLFVRYHSWFNRLTENQFRLNLP